jgi:glycyl-tRNA synthetase beta chain
MDKLVLEIGAEEIPAGYIKPALEYMVAGIKQILVDERIDSGEITSYGTPRRLAVLVNDVADSQRGGVVELMGPPEKVGYDDDGKPKIPAVKFAEKAGIPVEKVKIKETEKGRYLFAEKVEETLKTSEVLQNRLSDFIKKIPFPKVMHWGDLSVNFARPVFSILALYGTKIIPFVYGDISSGNFTFGHRFLNPEKITIQHPDDYVEKLRLANVIVDINERKQMVVTAITKAAAEAGGHILEDPELIDTVTNLIEFPVVVTGKFDEIFLELPDEVLITSMREHQKYFAVVDNNGALMRNFIVVNNTRAKDMAVVTRGHEKVIRARLADAKFFYEVDLKDDSNNWVEKLQGVLFQASLGTMKDKTARIVELAKFIAGIFQENTTVSDACERAAELCKIDLVSQVVVEFTKLQGIMGRVYALHRGETESVARAIQEHYMPLYSGAELPASVTGSIVSIADKIDTICGCFSQGLIPTGASDPYALRRQSIGIIQIMHANNMKYSLKSLIQKGLALYGIGNDNDEISLKIYDFFKGRIERLLVEKGYSKDVTASVSSISIDNVPDVWERVKALEGLKSNADFEPVAVAFKRVVNIIKKADLGETKPVDESLFEDTSESELNKLVINIKDKVTECIERSDFEEALSMIATIRPAVDTFFDNVMVMAEDENLKNNRLNLLSKISCLFSEIADFSKLTTA